MHACMPQVIEEKIVGPSQDELDAARSEGHLAMKDRNEKIEAARNAQKQIEHQEKAAAEAQAATRQLKMKLIKAASRDHLVDKHGTLCLHNNSRTKYWHNSNMNGSCNAEILPRKQASSDFVCLFVKKKTSFDLVSGNRPQVVCWVSTKSMWRRFCSGKLTKWRSVRRH